MPLVVVELALDTRTLGGDRTGLFGRFMGAGFGICKGFGVDCFDSKSASELDLDCDRDGGCGMQVLGTS